MKQLNNIEYIKLKDKKIISRAQIRGKSLDDDCKKAMILRNEYGINDNRCFCSGLIDCSTEESLDKCVKCKAFINNSKPIKEKI